MTSQLTDEIDRLRERLKRAEERLDGAKVVEAVGHASNKPIKLTAAEKERVSRALLATLDYLDGSFEEFIGPIREMRSWPGILRTLGPRGVQETAELARARVRAMPQEFGRALKQYLPDLELLEIHPLAIKTQAIPFEDSLHSLGSVAYAMKPDEPNQAAFQLSGNTFAQTFDKFQGEIDRIRQQIAEARRKITQGRYG